MGKLKIIILEIKPSHELFLEFIVAKFNKTFFNVKAI